MICPQCAAINEVDNVFCINCGSPVGAPAASGTGGSSSEMPTVQFSGQSYQTPPTIHASNFSQHQTPPPVNQTPPYNQAPPSMPNFNPVLPSGNYAAPSANGKKFIWLGFAAIMFLLLGGGAIYFASRGLSASETLPEHLGMFAQSAEKDKVSEIKKADFTNALTARDSLLKDDSLTPVGGDPRLILYADGKDIPVSDLRLVQLDTIKDDGNLKQLDFQVAPVDSQPAMKRIRLPNGIADGKYAFALMDGYLNDGKHKFWAFQVKNSSKSDNADLLKTVSVALKTESPTPAPAAKTAAAPNPVQAMPKVPPPASGQAAYSTTSKLILRSGPSQNSAKIRNLYQGERVYIIEYSSNYETFRNLHSNFAYVQTEQGQRGWVFAAYLR